MLTIRPKQYHALAAVVEAQFVSDVAQLVRASLHRPAAHDPSFEEQFVRRVRLGLVFAREHHFYDRAHLERFLVAWERLWIERERGDPLRHGFEWFMQIVRDRSMTAAYKLDQIEGQLSLLYPPHQART